MGGPMMQWLLPVSSSLAGNAEILQENLCRLSPSKEGDQKCFKLIRRATNTEVNPISTTDFMVGFHMMSTMWTLQ